MEFTSEARVTQLNTSKASEKQPYNLKNIIHGTAEPRHSIPNPSWLRKFGWLGIPEGKPHDVKPTQDMQGWALPCRTVDKEGYVQTDENF
jgi:hypothetical protein